MSRIICSFGVLLLIFNLSSCDLFEDHECDKTDKPETNFTLLVHGSLNHTANPGKPLFVQVEVYKKHCKGHLSSVFHYVCRSNFVNDLWSEMPCGVGYTFGFRMNNEKDELVFTFKYSDVDPPTFNQPFAQRVLKYSSGFQKCPTYPNSATARFIFEARVDGNFENPTLQRFEFQQCV